MLRSLALFVTLAAAGAVVHAHENLELDSPFHRLLHAIGTEGLVVLGGSLLAIVVGVLVRRELRKARTHRRHEG
ncbi:MAG: hypothetical protein AB7I32_06880 [Gammaproteobacteria bacterium]